MTPTPSKLRLCVYRQILKSGKRPEIQGYLRSFGDFANFTEFLRRRQHLLDNCQNAHPIFRPPGALTAEQRARFLKICHELTSFMKKNVTHKKGTWEWIELASYCLFWTLITSDLSYYRTQDVHKPHIKKYPALQRWMQIVKEKKLSLEIAKWDGNTKQRLILTDALKKRNGVCTEKAQAYIRLWREFMNLNGVPKSQARISGMDQTDYYHRFGSGHGFCKIEVNNKTLLLDPSLTIHSTTYKSIQWLKHSKRESEIQSWLIYVNNRQGTSIFFKMHKRYHPLFQRHFNSRYNHSKANYYFDRGWFDLGRHYASLTIPEHGVSIRATIVKSYLMEGKIQDALNEATVAIRKSPLSSEINIFLGLIHIIKGQERLAHTYLNTAQKNDLTGKYSIHDSLIESAASLIQLNRKIWARKILDYLIQNPPRERYNWSVFYEKLVTVLLMGRYYNKAVTVLKIAIKKRVRLSGMLNGLLTAMRSYKHLGKSSRNTTIRDILMKQMFNIGFGINGIETDIKLFLFRFSQYLHLFAAGGLELQFPLAVQKKFALRGFGRAGIKLQFPIDSGKSILGASGFSQVGFGTDGFYSGLGARLFFERRLGFSRVVGGDKFIRLYLLDHYIRISAGADCQFGKKCTPYVGIQYSLGF